MANIKSQIKRNRQNEKRRLRNRDFRGAARSAVKDARSSFETGQDTVQSVMAAISALDIAAKKGAIHPRNASRRKGRLMKHMAALGLHPQAASAEPVPTSMEAEKETERKSRDEKESKPARESKPKAEEAKKPAAKAPARTSAKKPAAKKPAKKEPESVHSKREHQPPAFISP